MQNLIVIDANSLIHRAFYALPLMRTKEGAYTNAVYGFFTMFFSVIDQYKPSYVAVAFDRKEKTFRHENFTEYKAGRKPTPRELGGQFDMLKNALEELSITVVSKAGYEADDFLGALSKQAESMDIHSYLVTGDRDALQLISDKTTVLLTKKGVSDLGVMDEAALFEKYGIKPSQIIDMKGLMGDSSDNIPGVPGVGEKTALKLLAQYPTIDQIYENIEQLPKNKMREKLEANKELAFLSYDLATICRDIPDVKNVDEMNFSGIDDEKLMKVFTKLEFSTLLKRRGLSGMPEIKSECIELSGTEDLREIVSTMTQGAIMIDESEFYIAKDSSKEWHAVFTYDLFGGVFGFEECIEIVKPLFEVEDIVVYNKKELEKLVGRINEKAHDIMLGAWVLNPTARNISLQKLAEQVGCTGVACSMIEIAKLQKSKIEQHELTGIYCDMELPLVHVLRDMETQGVRIDKEELKILGEKYSAKISKLSEEIYELCGGEFNISSPQQLGVMLFEKMNLPVIKKTKTGYSTDVEVLEKLAEDFPEIEKIIEYRQFVKLKSTYIEGLDKCSVNSKIHTTFQQTATATGRLSSTEPNLQNIPIRSEISSEIRRAFLPEMDMFVTADYSQIELRVLAHISGDDHMIDAFLRDEDIHTRTASEVFHVAQSEVTSTMRSSAKAVNFGIVYGISDFGLARQLGISRKRAGEFISNYLAQFTGVASYMKDIVEQAKHDGFVKTLFGRVRYIDELSSSNFNTRSFGERAAMNTPIQGTAADIMKVAMIDVHKKLKGMKSKLVLQVHDELIVDVFEPEAQDVKQILMTGMENAMKMKVPLKVNVASGKNWAEAK